MAFALAIAAPDALANISIPASNTSFTLKPKQKKVVVIKGAQGCKFNVFAESSNPDAVKVTYSKLQKTAHVVRVEAVGPGGATVNIATENGTESFCQGFNFVYPVSVDATTKDFVNQARGKLRDASKDLRSLVLDIKKFYCSQLNDIIKDLVKGEIDSGQAGDQVFDAGQDLIDDLRGEVCPYLDDLYDEIWGRASEYTLNEVFLDMTPEVVSFIPGGCGEWDRFEDALSREIDRAVDTVEQKTKSSFKALDKQALKEDADWLAILDPPVLDDIFGSMPPVPLPAPVPQLVPPPPPKNLGYDWNLSGRLSSSPVSELKVGGVADPGAGMVNVQIDGPDGFSTSANVNVSDACTFKAEFSGLKPGAYVVTLTQGANGPVTKTMVVV